MAHALKLLPMSLPATTIYDSFDVFEPSVYQLIVLSFGSRSNVESFHFTLLLMVTFNFPMKLTISVKVSLGRRANGISSLMAVICWDEITYAGKSLQLRSYDSRGYITGTDPDFYPANDCQLGRILPLKQQQHAFEAQATVRYVIIGLTIMVYISLIILGLQPEDFPASRLLTMCAFVALTMVKFTCCFHQRVKTSMGARYLKN